ncbi:MAG: hypothetical protein M3336_10010 [Chloroflexota bacterium]|nr:hypothetical protein [Chloroflexota bacterium]
MSGLALRFGGGPYGRGAGCALAAHYAEIQAVCDALGHAAQLEMAEAIERGDEVGRERAYGKWLGIRGMLRAIEARSDEWTPVEQQMLERIDWGAEQFRFPGIEPFEVPLTEPGAGAAPPGDSGSSDDPGGHTRQR